jgi:Abnormal spindle-like microcephaly-assoc'd, ASPM-SPD-2-Hydin
MRLPQSISQPFSIRVISLVTITLLAAMLPVYAGAATQQLTCTPSRMRFGAVPVGQTETQIVVLTNSGTTSVTVTANTMTESEFTLSNLSLPLTLAAGQSISVNLTFSPTTTGYTSGGSSFTSNASNPQLRLLLVGTGATSASIIASPSSLSFGQVAVGSSSTLPVVLTNTRTWKVTLTTLQLSGAGFSVTGATLPITLSTGQSITLNLTFAPLSAITTSGSVFVTGPGLNVPLNGTGTGTTAGQLTITPSLVNFGNVPVGTTVTQPITMSATGSSVTVSADASSSSQFVLNGASLPFTIPAGQGLSFNVAFTPQSSGTTSGSLSFTSNASISQTVESLTGDGTIQSYSVNLSWNASTDVSGYNVYRSTSSNGTYAKINSALDPSTAYTDSGVTGGATYYYEATAVNSSGQESGLSTPPVVAVIP